ncbi:hypothetical protein Tco_0571538 [Tanacetum coccineum]
MLTSEELFRGLLIMSNQSRIVGKTCNIKRGRDTKIPESGGPPVKVGDEAIHKELGDKMKSLTLMLLSKNGKVKVVFEASIRRHLKLEDSDGISTLSTAKIFEQLAFMGFSSNIEVAKEVARREVISPPVLKISTKDKGKAIMTEPEKPLKKKDQIQSDEELALRLHVEEQAKFEIL